MRQMSNDESLDLFADLLEPVAEIISDQEVRDILSNDGKKVLAVKAAIKNHKGAIVEILARLDGVPVEEYRVNVIALPGRLLKLLNRPEMAELFTGADPRTGGGSSGSATVSTGDGA